MAGEERDRSRTIKIPNPFKKKSKKGNAPFPGIPLHTADSTLGGESKEVLAHAMAVAKEHNLQDDENPPPFPGIRHHEVPENTDLRKGSLSQTKKPKGNKGGTTKTQGSAGVSPKREDHTNTTPHTTADDINIGRRTTTSTSAESSVNKEEESVDESGDESGDTMSFLDFLTTTKPPARSTPPGMLKHSKSMESLPLSAVSKTSARRVEESPEEPYRSDEDTEGDPPAVPDNLPSYFMRHSIAFGDKCAFFTKRKMVVTAPQTEKTYELYTWEPLTWAQYRTIVRRLARCLVEFGTRVGERTAIFTRSCPEAVAFHLACLTVGLVPTTLPHDYPLDKAAAILKHSGATIVMVQTEQQWRGLKEQLASQHARSIAQVIILEGYDGPMPPLVPPPVLAKALDGDGDRPERDAPHHLHGFTTGAINLAELSVSLYAWAHVMLRGKRNHDRQPAVNMRLEKLDKGHLAYLCYDTAADNPTARPLMFSHRNLYWTAQMGTSLLSMDHADRVLSWQPLAHLGALLLAVYLPVFSGAAVYFASSPPRSLPADLVDVQPTLFFAPFRFWRKLNREVDTAVRRRTAALRRAATVSAQRSGANRARAVTEATTHAMYRSIRDGLGLGRVRVCLTDALFTKRVAEFLSEKKFGFPQVYQVYSLPENTGVVCFNASNAASTSGTIGNAFPGVKLRIDEATGELLLRGPTVFLGYFKNPAATQDRIRDGWLRSGDVGGVDESARINITRLKQEAEMWLKLEIDEDAAEIERIRMEVKLKEEEDRRLREAEAAAADDDDSLPLGPTDQPAPDTDADANTLPFGGYGAVVERGGIDATLDDPVDPAGLANLPPAASDAPPTNATVPPPTDSNTPLPSEVSAAPSTDTTAPSSTNAIAPPSTDSTAPPAAVSDGGPAEAVVEEVRKPEVTHVEDVVVHATMEPQPELPAVKAVQVVEVEDVSFLTKQAVVEVDVVEVVTAECGSPSPAAPTTAAHRTLAPSASRVALPSVALREIEIEDAEVVRKNVESVYSDGEPTDWISLGYAENSKKRLRVAGVGCGGLEELKDSLPDDQVRYCLLRLGEQLGIETATATKFVFLTWAPEAVPFAVVSRISSHKTEVAAFFGNFHGDLYASRKAELSFEKIADKVTTSTRRRVTTDTTGKRVQRLSSGIYSAGSVPNTQGGACKLKFDNKPAIQLAIDRVRNDDDEANWVVLGYSPDVAADVLMLLGVGTGMSDLCSHFADEAVCYALWRAPQSIAGSEAGPKYVLVVWTGELVPSSRRSKVSAHLPAVAAMVGPYHVDYAAARITDLSEAQLIQRIVGEALGPATLAPPGDGLAALKRRSSAAGLYEPNFTKHEDVLRRDIKAVRAGTAKWAMMTYDDTGVVMPLGTGAGGIAEVISQLRNDQILYIFLGIEGLIDGISLTQKFVLVTWVGEQVLPTRKAAVVSHKGTVTNFIGPYHVAMEASMLSEVSEDAIMRRIKDAAGSLSRVVSQELQP